MALDDTDRRRLFLAALVTVVALPTLWWLNRDDGTARPNTAAVGVDVGPAPAEASTPEAEPVTVPVTVGRSNLPSDPTVVEGPPVFLDGPAAQVAGGVSEIAIPNPDALETIITRATFGQFAGAGTCLAREISTGREITVVNLDNNRSITCRAVLAPDVQQDDLVLQVDQFTQLADLTDAPIPVQIRL